VQQRRGKQSGAFGHLYGVSAEETAITGPHVARADFERAFRSEATRLYYLALTIVRSPTDAEDVVQETALSAWRAWPRLRDPGQPGPWLTRICVNHSVHRRRGLGRLHEAAVSVEWLADPHDPLSLSGSLLDFDRVFQTLSPRQRAVVALHFYHGYTAAECATLMGCRPGTARSHLARALAVLKQEMRSE
jgi:RNA polymerase sigma factor (sigma-70 family)